MIRWNKKNCISDINRGGGQSHVPLWSTGASRTATPRWPGPRWSAAFWLTGISRDEDIAQRVPRKHDCVCDVQDRRGADVKGRPCWCDGGRRNRERHGHIKASWVPTVKFYQSPSKIIISKNTMSRMQTLQEKHPELFRPDLDIDRRKCTRTVPMQVLALGMSRTGTSCKFDKQTSSISKLPLTKTIHSHAASAHDPRIQ